MFTHNDKKKLVGFPRYKLAEWLAGQKVKPYRAAQILKWIYQKQADSMEEMTDIGKDLRHLLHEHFIIGRLAIRDIRTSSDKSRKFLFELSDGHLIESVLIPEKDHYTLCLSSQVGCPLGCHFCVTGKGGLKRNLSLFEIISQLRDIIREKNHNFNEKSLLPLKNIVFMGMGEPLLNYDNLIGALNIITNPQYGFGFSQRRVTVSTAGLVDRFAELGNDTSVNIAISLNATRNEVRNRLMPINQSHPIESLIEATKNYPLKKRRMITFEYILIRGINDSEKDARELARLLRPVRCKINLIPLNESPDIGLKRPEETTIKRFQEILVANHYTAVIRNSKGADIFAACGQLAGSSPSSETDAST